MERLVTVKVMQERYGCSNPTARKYLRQCPVYLENPLCAPEWAVDEWEQNRTVVQPGIRRRREAELIITGKYGDPTRLPRKR